MLITPLRVELIDAVADVMRLGEPYATVRGPSDYWLYNVLPYGGRTKRGQRRVRA
ncbi:hypothetical protein [Dactylosporangium sp. CA-139066]|uniref:hypothetical protein n=1 Tax=Dactylosporangium sp. CA-139066 TaxID=3239930 RepID=UPI003D8CBF75